ncbi:hypothetical protein HDV04_000290 [Boothiomyces sp. JEL0838]|nr:hypothetical protein HDV04_000290 [Boothiomyces sp. JEL0838]
MGFVKKYRPTIFVITLLILFAVVIGVIVAREMAAAQLSNSSNSISTSHSAQNHIPNAKPTHQVSVGTNNASSPWNLTSYSTPKDILYGNGWSYFSGNDPTKGYVDYVDQLTAQSLNMLQIGTSGQEYVQLSSIAGSPPKSIRIFSNQTFTGGLFLFDILHMPSGPGSWPAIWLVGPNWPLNGEIDILEGTNGFGNNTSTLHTQDRCIMIEDGLPMDCSHLVSRTGCNSVATAPNTFGEGFNSVQGGIYAMEWIAQSNGHIKIWFFQRDSIPIDIINGKPLPDTWPTDSGAYSYFPFGKNCRYSNFASHTIVINIDFCGTWAGSVFNAQTGMNQGCANFVSNHPSALQNDYFQIYGIKVFNKAS